MFTKANAGILYDKHLRVKNNHAPIAVDCDLYMKESRRCIRELKVLITIMEEVILDFYDIKSEIKTRVNRE